MTPPSPDQKVSNYLVERTRIREYGLKPSDLQGYFTNFVIWKYSSVDNTNDPWLRKNYPIWAPVDEANQQVRSAINVLRAGEFDPKTADMRPSIVIQRDDVRLGAQQAIGDRQEATPGALLGQYPPGQVPIMGQVQQATLLEGAFRFVVVHTTPEAAERLGEDLWLSMIDFMHILRKDLGPWMKILRPAVLSKCAPFEESKTHFAVEFHVTYTLNYATMLTERAPRLKNIKFIDGEPTPNGLDEPWPWVNAGLSS